MHRLSKALSADGIECVVDILRVIAWVKEALSITSAESRRCFRTSLSIAEKSLRRTAADMKFVDWH